MVSVYRMQSSTMVTKKAIWEIKSYWAARAGNTIAADGCFRSKRWPDTVNNNAFLKKAGNYAVDKVGDVVIGRDDSSESSFRIYYINHLLSNPARRFSSSNVVETALQKNFNDMKLKYDKQDLEYNKYLWFKQFNVEFFNLFESFVGCDKGQIILECGGRDNGIGKFCAILASNKNCPFFYLVVEWKNFAF